MARDIFGSINRLCIAQFGVEAEYIRRDTEKTAIRGVYDSNYTVLDPNTGVPVMSCTPVLAVAGADIPGGKWQEGDKVVIDGITFTVEEPHNDSEGITELFLRRESPR